MVGSFVAASSSTSAAPSRAIRAVTSTVENCLGASCPDYEACYVVKARRRVQLVTQPHRGPAAARNNGAARAVGEILVFFDADTMPHPDVLARISGQFDELPDTAAIFGSYDVTPTAPHLVSQYRNLHHHFVHQDGSENASTFWAGCGAIRREIFQAIGGFNTEYARPCIEDVELGCRLVKEGYTIRLDRQMFVTHRKQWTTLNMITTDVRDRAAPWTRLICRERSISDVVNLHWSQQLSALLTWLAVLLLTSQALVSPWAANTRPIW